MTWYGKGQAIAAQCLRASQTLRKTQMLAGKKERFPHYGLADNANDPVEMTVLHFRLTDRKKQSRSLAPLGMTGAQNHRPGLKLRRNVRPGKEECLMAGVYCL